MLTPVTLEVYDAHTLSMVECVSFDAWTLVSPLLAHTTNGSVSYTDAISEVSHSVRVYKGKIFVLVGAISSSVCFRLIGASRGSTKCQSARSSPGLIEYYRSWNRATS